MDRRLDCLYCREYVVGMIKQFILLSYYPVILLNFRNHLLRDFTEVIAFVHKFLYVFFVHFYFPRVMFLPRFPWSIFSGASYINLWSWASSIFAGFFQLYIFSCIQSCLIEFSREIAGIVQPGKSTLFLLNSTAIVLNIVIR